ncbi:MAG: aldehyde dehydrogenase, partial [Candidatus Omnitrophica bacterium]|nr:aldehyde dehydrogenase [Candidatus Omnitrophota bacterium]
MKQYLLLINGENKDSKIKQDIINPSNGEAIARVSFADKDHIEKAISSARNAFDKGSWKTFPLEKRKEFLLKISQGILENAQELAELESLNSGKPIKETTFMDIPSAAKTFEYFANNLEHLLQPETINIDSQISSVRAGLFYEPRGVTVLIVPWNYPLLIACWKLAQSLAAGNTVILKPASLTPLSALKLGEIIQGTGLPEGVVNIIAASGDSSGQALCSDKRIDMISFTGSNSVGKKIIDYTSKNVKKLLIELGGKSASIILEDADLEAAVNTSLCSIFLNQGQMCTAMSRIFIQDSIYDKFIADFVEKAKKIKIGPAMDFQTQIGPLISLKQRETVSKFVERAKSEGARVLCGGNIPGDTELKKGFFFEPTVLAEASLSSEIFQQEVFGPVALVGRFKTESEAVELANKSDFGLAGCIFSQDKDRAGKIAAQLDSGTIWINTYGMFFEQLP